MKMTNVGKEYIMYNILETAIRSPTACTVNTISLLADVLRCCTTKTDLL